ncbi:MAG: DUF4249 domain-containing protein [Bacteroidota bacterium]|nr:DUF4249 domain-containing protein [Bacteroidota bacterium]
MRNIFPAFILLIVACSCIKEYNLQPDSIKSRLVVDGTITDKNGPYLIRLTKSRNNMHIEQVSWQGDTVYNYRFPYDGTVGVQDAEVFITDRNTSFTDTLVKCPTGIWYHQEASANYPGWSRFEIADTSIIMGFYKTTKLKGIPGHTYALTIKWQDQEYHAESYMPPVPALDSVQFKLVQGDIGKDNHNIPLIYFKEPQNERNYYLFKTQAVYGWPYSILSDEYLNSYVNGLDVCKGVTPDYWLTNYPYDHTDSYFIEMHSITNEGYEYYKALIQQFKTDGGGYSPSPASPPTNLDNGALGFFRASAVNRVDFKKDENHQWIW